MGTKLPGCTTVPSGRIQRINASTPIILPLVNAILG